jgi:hypothetical protein
MFFKLFASFLNLNFLNAKKFFNNNFSFVPHCTSSRHVERHLPIYTVTYFQCTCLCALAAFIYNFRLIQIKFQRAMHPCLCYLFREGCVIMSVAGWMDGCLAGWLAWLLFHCTRALYVTIFFNRIKYQPLKDAIIIFLFIMKQTTRSGGSLAPPSLLLLCFFILSNSSQHCSAFMMCVCSAVL